MKRFMLICFISCLGMLKCNAQLNHINLSFSKLEITGDGYSTSGHNINFQIDYNYKLTDYLSMGGYLGLVPDQSWMYKIQDTTDIFSLYKASSSILINYGLKTNLYLIPLFLKKDIPRIDLYVSGNFGFITIFGGYDNDVTPQNGTYIDITVLGGFAVYLIKEIGLFAEAGYKYFKYYKGFNARYGLTFRF